MIRRKIVSGSGAVATLALLLAASPCALAQEPPKGLEGLHEALDASVAARFAAMQKLSARFSTPEAAGKLVDILVARDAAAFNGLVGDLDLPLTGTCWWVHEIVEKAVRVEKPKDEKQCTLKENLTGEQLALYLNIAIRYGQIGPVFAQAGGAPVFTVADAIVIPEGPFRDDLEAAGLLDCKLVPITNLAARPVVGDPFEFCFQPPPQR
jgi:hypothetical protein